MMRTVAARTAALLALLLAGASSENFTVAPARTSHFCQRGYLICSYGLSCPGDYALECQSIACEDPEQVCTDLGANFRPSEFNGHCEDWPGEVDERYRCCQCVGSEPLPATVEPTSAVNICYETKEDCPSSMKPKCCKKELSCPDGYSLSATRSLCGKTTCEELGPTHVISEFVKMSDDCAFYLFPVDQVFCTTCEKDSPGPSSSQEPTTASATTGATTTPMTVAVTTAPTTSTGGASLVAPRSDYTLPTQSGEYCLTDGYEVCDYPLSCPGGYELQCQGIACEAEAKTCGELGTDFTAKRWSGHCAGEQWDMAQQDMAHRYECCRCARSIPSDARWEDVGESGKAACRGRDSNDNNASYYIVEEGVTELDACQAKCLESFPSCKGIEFSLGRCEIWTRPEGITWKELSGFTCMRFGWPTSELVPVDGGEGRACRGERPNDSTDDYYSVVSSETLKECTASCSAAPICEGIEFSYGRCEIWHRPIGASRPMDGFTCLAFPAYQPDEPDEPKIPVFGKEPIVLP